MGVVIGKSGKDIAEEESLNHIESYFLGIDFTDRTLQEKCRAEGADWGSLGKSADTFAAVSDFVDKSEVEDCGDLEI